MNSSKRITKGYGTRTWLGVPCTLSLVTALFFLSGCAIQFAEQEVQFRYDPEEDVVDLLIIYKGVTTTDDKEGTLTDAMNLSYAILDGRRVLSIPAWGLSEDLDELVSKSQETGDAAEIDAELISAIDNIALVEVDAFLDEERLSAYQIFQMEHFSHWLEYFNRSISESILKSVEEGRFASDTPLLDLRTRELFRRRAECGLPWIRLDGNAFELDLPMTADSFDQVSNALIDHVQSESCGTAAVLGQHLAHLERLEVGEERVLLRFRAPVSGIYRFTDRRVGAEYNSRLLDALTEDGLTLEETIKLEDVRRLLEPESQEVKD